MSGAGKAAESLVDSITRYMSLSFKTKFAVKRGYDDWFFKQYYADRRRKFDIKDQMLDVDHHAKMGSELAVSHFVIRRMNGRIRDHKNNWLTRFKELPPEYSRTFKVTGIDVSGKDLVTEGIDNFVGLDSLESLDLSKNPRLDDFACDQLARQFRNSQTLTGIDLSYNPLVSVFGLEILMRIPTLRYIIALETMASKFPNIDLFTVAAEDERRCSVFVHGDGRQFRSQDLEETRFDTSQIPRLNAN